MVKEAIILIKDAGLNEIPKALTNVAGLPFLTFTIRHLLSQGIQRFFFALPLKDSRLEEFLANQFYYLDYHLVIGSEKETGNLIRRTLEEVASRDVLLVNGEVLFRIDVDDLTDVHMQLQADCTFAIYSSNTVDNDERIIPIIPDSKHVPLSGICVLNKIAFLKKEFPSGLFSGSSFGKSRVEHLSFYGVMQDKPYYDITISSNEKSAQQDLIYPPLQYEHIDKTWTLFLDRDGVINYNKDESYVFHTGEFRFIPGAIEAIRRLSFLFGKIIIVTNQRGIGKGLMTAEALSEIHEHMLEEIKKGGGRIDDLYYCGIVDDKHPDRKPNPGMLLEAKHMHAEIDFSKSIMVGDKMSDMQLGRNAGCHTILISANKESSVTQHHDIDACYPSLGEFAQALNIDEDDHRVYS